jgi:hypothetical protein
MSNILNPCPVCKGPVDITTAKTNAAGQAVHEECYYLFPLGLAQGKKQGKAPGKE